jgi:hypothetical protein
MLSQITNNNKKHFVRLIIIVADSKERSKYHMILTSCGTTHITLFRSITMIISWIFCGILSIPYNTNMDLNNVMHPFPFLFGYNKYKIEPCWDGLGDMASRFWGGL